MSLFRKKKKSKNISKYTKMNVNVDGALSDSCLGVQKIFQVENSDDIVVEGEVCGIFKKGMKICIANLGNDDVPTVFSQVEDLELNDESVEEVSDTNVKVRIKDGAKYTIKVGTILFTEKTTEEAQLDGYRRGLFGAYVLEDKDGNCMSQIDYESMSLSDLAEIKKIYAWYINVLMEQNADIIKKLQEINQENGTDYKSEIEKIEKFMEETQEHSREKISDLTSHMCEKLLNIDEIYVLYNRLTGEPHLNSQIYTVEEDRYWISPPETLLFTKEYVASYIKEFDLDYYEVRKIENGQDKKGIYEFLQDLFYCKGACGINIIHGDFFVDKEVLIKEPDYSNIPEKDRPITNPDLKRWMLLLGQISNVETDDIKVIKEIFTSKMLGEAAKARLIIPMEHEDNSQSTEEKGGNIAKKDGKMRIVTAQGKGDREMVYMYTDWKQFEKACNKEKGWQGMVQTVPQLINIFDCAIDYTDNSNDGCYIDKELYDGDMKMYMA